jgi:hypothetical protein
MKKLIRTIGLIMIAFIVASISIYRLRAPRPLPPPAQQRITTVEPEIKIVSGQISDVDEDNRTLVLDYDDNKIIIGFDDRTAVIDSGEITGPASITTGAEATVKYTELGGKKRARSIKLIRQNNPTR